MQGLALIISNFLETEVLSATKTLFPILHVCLMHLVLSRLLSLSICNCLLVRIFSQFALNCKGKITSWPNNK